MQNKKIMVTLASVCIALVAVVTALVIVLVSGGQGATSNITVKFVATDVSCKIEGNYKRINMVNTKANGYYWHGDMGSLTIDENTSTGTLNPEEDITLDKTYSRVAFKYKFTNTMLTTPMYIELTGLPDNDTTNDPEGITESCSNVKMLYYNNYFESMQGYPYGLYDENFSETIGKLVVPAQCTKIVYVVVSVTSLTEDAEFTGQIEWTLTRGEKPTASYDDVSGKLTMTNIYEGCEVTESDLNHSTVNIRSLDWYTDSTVSAKAVFPITTTESTTLYSSYLKGNIAEENISYFNKALSVTRNTLITGAVSEVDGYTPISATDTTLVIPDMMNYKMSDGSRLILPIAYISGAGYSNTDSSILYNNSTVTTLYVGNNVAELLSPASGTSVLSSIYVGEDIATMQFGDSEYAANASLANIYMQDGTTTYWGHFTGAGESIDKVVEESIMASSTALVSYFKSSDYLTGGSSLLYRFCQWGGSSD